MNKKIMFKIYIFVLIFVSAFSLNLFANEETLKNEEQVLYSDEYKEYLELSDEEKANKDIVPRKYEISVDKYLENRESIVSADENTTIPTKFDLRDKIEINVENQGSYGVCWDFASLTSVETYIALNNNELYDFSELHVDYLTSTEYKNKMNINSGYRRNLHQGGNFFYFYYDYALLGNGPIWEFNVPYNASYDESEYSKLAEFEPAAYVNSIVNFPSLYKGETADSKISIVRNDIKKHILKNGSLYASITSTGMTTGANGDVVLNEQNNYTFDHAVSIIGWDDNYSKENFPEEIRPQKDGAYIALNSWGNYFGDNGAFYISYEDICVEVELSGVSSVTSGEIQTKNVTFKDKNLYNYFVENYSNYIKEKKETTLTIGFIDSFVENLLEIQIDRINDLSGLENFSGLQYVYITNSQLTDLSILEKFTKLTGLSIYNTKINDWSSLKKLNLEKIDLTENNLTDITLLNDMKLLKSISISTYDYNISGILDLSSNTVLEDLSIYIPTEFDKNVTIKNMVSKKTKEIYLYNLNIDKSEFKDKTKITNIILKDVELEDLSFLTDEYKDLLEIFLTNTNIKNIDDLSKVKTEGIKYIYISQNEVVDISKIENRDDIMIRFTQTTKEENLDKLIFKDEKVKVSMPKEILYTINKYYGGEYYDLYVENGILSEDEKNITLDTSNIKDKIPLKITLLSKDDYIENADIVYTIYFDVKDKSLYTKGYARINYTTHVQNVGWQEYVEDGKMAGISGLGLRLEGIKIKLDGNLKGKIAYTTHVQNIGWQDEIYNEINNNDPEMSGTSGKGLRLEAIKIRLTDELEENYDIYYRVHAQNAGWLGWAKNGEEAGTAGYGFRLEGIEIKLVKKGEKTPESTIDPFVEKVNVTYTTHVENTGWLKTVSNGKMSGTLGKELRLEAIKINASSTKLSGDIVYSTHVQNIGWQDEVLNGEISGTSGKGLRLEAIKIRLTNELEENYDIYYRVHAQNAGWLGWAKNGEPAGTAGYGFRLEGIEIKLVDKNSNFSGSRENYFVEK